MIRYLKELGKGEEVEHDENYYEFVESRFKQGTFNERLCHAAMGISGEAGELLDSVKKTVFYGKDVDMANIIEELGDLEFYMQALRTHLNIRRDYVLQSNMDKLRKRYPDGFSEKAAQERADKLGA